MIIILIIIFRASFNNNNNNYDNNNNKMLMIIIITIIMILIYTFLNYILSRALYEPSSILRRNCKNWGIGEYISSTGVHIHFIFGNVLINFRKYMIIIVSLVVQVVIVMHLGTCPPTSLSVVRYMELHRYVWQCQKEQIKCFFSN